MHSRLNRSICLGIVLLFIVMTAEISSALPLDVNLVGEHLTDWAYGVSVSGNYAFITDCQNGLIRFNISDPFSPLPAGTYNTAGCALAAAVSGNYAYVADDYKGLVIIDISNPSSPTLICNYIYGLCKGYQCYGPIYARGVAISGNNAYLADCEDGLVILDIANPSSPQFVSTYDTGTNNDATGVAVAGNYAYLTDNGRGLFIVDISDPSSPTYVANILHTSSLNDVAVVGNYAYVAGIQGLVIVDITDPASPTIVGCYDTPCNAMDVAVVEGYFKYVYIADLHGGIVIFQVKPANEMKPLIKYTMFLPDIAKKGWWKKEG